MIERVRWQVRFSGGHWMIRGADGAPTETHVFTGNARGWRKAFDRAFREASRGMEEVS